MKKILVGVLAAVSILAVLVGLYLTVSIWQTFHPTTLSSYTAPLWLVLGGLFGLTGAAAAAEK